MNGHLSRYSNFHATNCQQEQTTESLRSSTSTSMIVGPPGAGALVLGGGFDLLNLFILADLCNTLGEYDKAVRACNQIGQ
ncbi:hypothetical protein GYMLUDRAFT_253467 [Collybiopsis luxurians FD-317 M1]|uniref:Uncharacterized protein n=1 Tax=Collybiopsis luxurians FD-317 M1 TaxID=944289 RepID=A0A0D0BK89_9AGAR|nr:hypothetical protein GYMLUDRAFT_253467 [Collybiopsis luxurians FD-317 M1]